MLNSRIIGLLLGVILLSKVAAFGQITYRGLVDSSLTVNVDSRLDSLVIRHIKANKAKDGLDGFRVQLFSGSGNNARQSANELRAEFLAQYPYKQAYVIYQTPNFKVRVGDYRTELEAIGAQRDLSYSYPHGFVVRDLIKFPVVEKEKNNTSVAPDDFQPFQKSSNGRVISEDIPKNK
ncbi:SPOR domain-containing protein [Bacteroidota bacterium]